MRARCVCVCVCVYVCVCVLWHTARQRCSKFPRCGLLDLAFRVCRHTNSHVYPDHALPDSYRSRRSCVARVEGACKKEDVVSSTYLSVGGVVCMSGRRVAAPDDTTHTSPVLSL